MAYTNKSVLSVGSMECQDKSLAYVCSCCHNNCLILPDDSAALPVSSVCVLLYTLFDSEVGMINNKKDTFDVDGS